MRILGVDWDPRLILNTKYWRYWPLAVAVVVYLLIQGVTFRTGVGWEEFRYLWVVKSMEDGRLPWRDFVYIYGPLGPFFWYVATRLVGVELFAIRLLSVMLGLLVLWLSYCIAGRLLRQRWATATAGFCSAGILTFPFYSYTHLLSVITLLFALLCAMKYFDLEEPKWNICCALFSVATICIRPLQAGTVLFTTVLVATLFAPASLSKKRRKIGGAAIYACIVIIGVSTIVLGYSALAKFPLERWASSFVALWGPLAHSGPDLMIMRLPNPLMAVRSLFRSTSIAPGSAVSLIVYQGSVLLNLLAGHLAYMLAFLVPGAVSVLIAIRLFPQSRGTSVRVRDLFILSVCATGLGVYYHVTVSHPFQSDIASGGYLWNMVGGFLLQPGIIVGLALTYHLAYRSIKWLSFKWNINNLCRLPQVVVAIVAMYLVVTPKLPNLRFLATPMVSSEVPGVRHILLNNHYERAVIPAIEYLWAAQRDLPSFIFSPVPTYLALAPQEPAFPEYELMTLLDETMVVNSKMFPGVGTVATTLSDFMISRIASLNPIVILERQINKTVQPHQMQIFDAPHQSWEELVSRNYAVHRTFASYNPVDPNIVTNVFIYLPSK